MIIREVILPLIVVAHSEKGLRNPVLSYRSGPAMCTSRHERGGGTGYSRGVRGCVPGWVYRVGVYGCVYGCIASTRLIKLGFRLLFTAFTLLTPLLRLKHRLYASESRKRKTETGNVKTETRKRKTVKRKKGNSVR